MLPPDDPFVPGNVAAAFEDDPDDARRTLRGLVAARALLEAAPHSDPLKALYRLPPWATVARGSLADGW